MDTILSGILLSNHPDSLKKTLIQKIAVHGSQPQPVKVIQRVLDLTVEWYLNGDSSVVLNEGLIVYKSWAKYNLSTFEGFFNRDFLLHLLSTKFKNEANVVTLLHESLNLLQMSSTLNGHLQVVEAKAISFVREHPSLLCLSKFCEFLKEFRTCVPKGEFSGTFCISLIHVLSICSVPDNAEEIVDYIKDIGNVSNLIQQIWNNSNSDVVMQSLKAIFSIISSVDEADVEPSFCLGAVAQYLPTEMINVVVKYAIDDADIDNASMTAALQRIVDWLQWPMAKHIDQWIIAFLKGLASVKRYSVLITVTETKVEQVCEKIKFPLVRDGAISVLSQMLLSFQHSPEPFHKVITHLPKLFGTLKKENTPGSQESLRRMSELCHCCMYLHAGYPDLYDSIMDLIKDFPEPSMEVIKERLQESKWTAQVPDGVNYVSKVTQRSQTGKTGLFNLGNTCYMNSVLQVLYMCDERAVLSCNVTMDQKLLVKLQYVFAFLSHTQRPAYAPVMFLQMSRPPWFEPRHQHDCSEFLKYLLDQLHEQQMLTEKASSSHSNKEKDNSGDVVMRNDTECSVKDFSTVVRQEFGGKMQTSYTCLNCHNVSSRTEDFIDIPLAFSESVKSSSADNSIVQSSDSHQLRSKSGNGSPDKSLTTSVESKTEKHSVEAENSPLHLNDLLQFYLQPEKLTGDNKYHCDTCQGLQDGERNLKVVKAPDHLILTLLRFSYDIKLHARSKIFTEVKYPRTLILPIDTHNSPNNDDPNKRRSIRSAVTRKIEQCGLNVNTKRGEVYSLCGVVVHSGTSSECGHYYSYARHSLFCDPEIICDNLENCKSEDDFDFLQDKWYLFNDSRVSYATYSSFCDVTKRFTKDTAYVLFYKRIDPRNAEKQEVNLNSSIRVSEIDAPLRADLRSAISKDNVMYLKEQEKTAEKRNARKRPGSTTTSWFNWPNKDDDDNEPPGSCGGGKGGYGDLDTSGAKFVF